MSAQEAQVAQLTQQVNDTGAELDAIHKELQTELDALEAQIKEGKPPAEINLQPLQDAVNGLKPHADALQGLKPTPTPAAGAPTPSAAQEAAPTNPDGTAVENTTDPAVAAQQAATGSGGPPPTQ